MPHRGEIVQNLVAKKARSVSDLAKRMGYDRATLYRHFADPNLEDGIIMKYAKALKYDFSKEFPELSAYTNTLSEPILEYRPITLAEALKEVDHWRSKYIALLEKHNELLDTYNDVLVTRQRA